VIYLNLEIPGFKAAKIHEEEQGDGTLPYYEFEGQNKGN